MQIKSKSVFLLTLALALGLCAQVSIAQQALSAKDVWLYMPFDGSVDCPIPSQGLHTIHYKSAGKKPLEFVPGIRGQALRVTRENQSDLTVTTGIPSFPFERGSMVMWFRPNRELNDPDHPSFWLVLGGWASFDFHVENKKLLFYCTGNAQHCLMADLKDFIDDWKDKWHCTVANWDGKKRSLYLDGRLIGERDDVDPSGPINTLEFGCLGGNPEKPTGAFLDGDIDEFAILKAPMPEAQVADLYAKGKIGLLAALGGDVLGSLPRRAYVRGEKAALKVMPYAEGDALVVTAVPTKGGAPARLASLPCKEGEVTIDTAELRPGNYHLRLEVLKGGKPVVRNESLEMGINAVRAPEFPVGIDALNSYPDPLLVTMKDWHISLTGNGGFYSTDGFFKDLDRLYLYGISLQPCLNIHFHRAWMPYLDKSADLEDPSGKPTEKGVKELLQGLCLDDGTWFSTSIGSPFSRAGRKAMLARIEDVLKASQNHPGLHSLAFDDEYELRVGIDEKTKRRYYGDYGPEAVAYFKEKSALKAAVYPPTDPPGTILPDDHPYFKWRNIIGMPGDATTTGLHVNNAEQSELIHKLRTDVLTTAWSGGEYGECDAVMDYTYPTIWQPHPGYECGQARLDYMFDRHRARQRVSPLKPVWGLTGWWSNSLQDKPDWCVQDFRLSTIMTLAKGAKLVLWFTAYPPTDTPPGQLGAGLLSRKDLADETHRWSDWIYRYGGMFARLETRPSRRVAVLLSEANRVGQVHTYNNPIAFDRFYPAMRVAGVPVDLITDEQVLDGTLNQYEALCLFKFEYTTPSLWKKINEFASTKGKVVFCDNGCAEDLWPGGAIGIDCNVLADPPITPEMKGMDIILAQMAMNVKKVQAEMRPKLKPDDLQVTGSSFIAPHWLYGGDGRFLALVNYNINEPGSVSVELKKTGGVVYDLIERKVVVEAAKGEPLSWKAEGIEKAGWRPYLLLPEPITGVVAKAQLTDGKFMVSAKVQGVGGTVLKAAIPIHVEFIGPDGKEVTPYDTYTATDPSNGKAQVVIARATLMDSAGIWRVKVSELVSGKQLTLEIKL